MEQTYEEILSERRNRRTYLYEKRYYSRFQLLALRPDLEWTLEGGDQVENFNVGMHHRIELFQRDGFSCADCGSDYDLTLDHVHPRSKGGGNEDSNLATRCRSCNSKKGARFAEVAA